MTNGTTTAAPTNPPTTCLPPLPTLIPGVPPPPDPFTLLPALPAFPTLPPLPTIPPTTILPSSTPTPTTTASTYYNSTIYRPQQAAAAQKPPTAPIDDMTLSVGTGGYLPMSRYTQISPGNGTPPSQRGMPYAEYSY